MLTRSPDGARSVPLRVLVIDDQRIMVEKLRQMLASEISWVVHGVTDGKLALDEALEFRPTVILQDLIMPETGGLDLIRNFRERRELMDVPVIVLSALDAPELKRTCFENGANDYLVKLPEQIELLARIRYHCGAYQKGIERDEALDLLKVSQKQLASANLELQRQNGQDGLTGIANRRNFGRAERFPPSISTARGGRRLCGPVPPYIRRDSQRCKVHLHLFTGCTMNSPIPSQLDIFF